MTRWSPPSENPKIQSFFCGKRFLLAAFFLAFPCVLWYDKCVYKKKMPPFMYVLAVISVIILASYVVFAASGKLCFEKPETDGKAESHSYEAVKQITTINHKGSVWEKETSSSEAETTLSDREHTVGRDNYGSHSSGNNSGGSTSGEGNANTSSDNTKNTEEKPAEQPADNPADNQGNKQDNPQEEKTPDVDTGNKYEKGPLYDLFNRGISNN